MNRVRKSVAQDRRSKPRRKELGEEDLRKLIETDFPDRRSYKDRRAKPRRKAERKKG